MGDTGFEPVTSSVSEAGLSPGGSEWRSGWFASIHGGTPWSTQIGSQRGSHPEGSGLLALAAECTAAKSGDRWGGVRACGVMAVKRLTLGPRDLVG